MKDRLQKLVLGFKGTERKAMESVLITPTLASLLEREDYSTLNDPLFEPVVALYKDDEVVEAALKWLELTGLELEDARIWIQKLKESLD